MGRSDPYLRPDFPVDARPGPDNTPAKASWTMVGDGFRRPGLLGESARMDFLEIVIDGPIDIDRDELEEAISEAFAGIGEIATTDIATTGLDLELDQDMDDDDVLERVFDVIDDLGVGDAIRVRPGDDEEWLRLSDWQA